MKEEGRGQGRGPGRGRGRGGPWQRRQWPSGRGGGPFGPPPPGHFGPGGRHGLGGRSGRPFDRHDEGDDDELRARAVEGAHRRGRGHGWRGHAHAHAAHVAHARWRQGAALRRRGPFFAWFLHASLRRKLFVSFGVAIVLSAGLGFALWSVLAPGTAATLLAAGVASVALWAAAGAIAWGFTRPLVELVSVAQDLGEGKLDRRMRLRGFGRPVHDAEPEDGHGHGHGHGHGELAVLAHAVNTMAERIEAQIAGQRELLAGVSHELRTPLGHLRVLIDTAREGGAQAQGEALLSELEREVLELDNLVDELLVHSRLEFERVELRTLDPVAVALRALERAGVDASRLEIDEALDEGARVEGDPTLLGRALANLLNNAREHGGGVEVLRVGPGELDGAPALRFAVEDRGPGFAPEERERVFETFFQGEDRRGGSLGLGLALVWRIALAHGGRAAAHEREGGGACVDICLPLA
ncbi:HAMP domain-containing protein [Pseudenhygromyxa sp. WMMC2535]|uniref:HAMP domain-containing sensor histidine kinase n=1 Tax=Pseudenhygromyxa sp. WMMC2535 TaxID=2712867 RepID=UPI001553EA12|nr:ATP-binding protein [Pseudenhygromyxa sp. WMMC2535]NVB40781.1 HAMP domain-containing protein [Pseudenhygromyxa sp. WMMC2535]